MDKGAGNRFKGEIEEIREQIRALTKRLDSLVLATEVESNAGEPAPKPKKLTRREAALAAERMAAVHRFPDGSIAAKDIKIALLRQLRQHNYTPRQFSSGIDLDTKIVMKWCKGELVIRPDELKKICRHLGVRNLFEGVV